MIWTSPTENRPGRRLHRSAPGIRMGCALAAIGLFWLVGDPARSAESPMAVVRRTTDTVLAVLRDTHLSNDEKRARIENIVYINVGLRTISRLVLARNWRRLTPPQQDEFMREFKKYLSHTYGDNIERYKNESVVVLSEREEARGDYTVKTMVIRNGADDLYVDYRLRRSNGEWRIIDFIVEGVSMVSNFRSQFKDIMTKRGPDRMLELLREKNANAKSLES